MDLLRTRARDLDSDDRLDREWKSQRLIVEPVGMHGLPDPAGAPAVPLLPVEEEISIPMVAIEMGITVGERGGAVGGEVHGEAVAREVRPRLQHAAAQARDHLSRKALQGECLLSA